MKGFIQYIEEAVLIPKDSNKVHAILTKGFREWYQEFRQRSGPPDYVEEFYQLIKKWMNGGLRSRQIWFIPAGASREASAISPVAPREGIIGAVYHPFFKSIKIYVDDQRLMKWLLSGDIAKKWTQTLTTLMKVVDHELVHKEQWARIPDKVREAAMMGLGKRRQKWGEQFGIDYFFQPHEMMAYAQDAAKEIQVYAQKNHLDPFDVQKHIVEYIKKSGGNLFDSKEFPSYAVYLVYGIGNEKFLKKFHKYVFEYLEQL